MPELRLQTASISHHSPVKLQVLPVTSASLQTELGVSTSATALLFSTMDPQSGAAVSVIGAVSIITLLA